MTGSTLVYGMGVTGRAVAKALDRRGTEVLCVDDRPSPDHAAWTAASGIAVLDGSTVDLDDLLAESEAVLPAPGLPDHHRLFADAERLDVPILSEFDLAQRWDHRPAVAVTGTDGKTTVVTLIASILEAAGIRAAAVGNTDTPWVEAIDDPAPAVFVVEASSFRLAHSRRFAPRVGVWLNFGPDHLDAHASLADYERAKAAIWTHLGDGLAIANRDDPVVSARAAKLTGPVATFGVSGPGANRVEAGWLVIDDERLVAVDDLPRRLPHDLMNALAACVAAQAMGADRAACAETLVGFAGLEHRVEVVGESAGVVWVNDSKATTPHAAQAALGGYESVVLLAGGRNKGLSFEPMAAQHHRIKHLVALGEAAADVQAAFGPGVESSVATSMSEAIEIADRVAGPGDVVLLSPACASFDWYRNYAARGDDFRRLVNELVLDRQPEGSR